MKPGTVFRHGKILDPSWTPGPGQKYADAPKALCRVTKIAHAVYGDVVYYGIGADARKAQYRAVEADLLKAGAEVQA